MHFSAPNRLFNFRECISGLQVLTEDDYLLDDVSSVAASDQKLSFKLGTFDHFSQKANKLRSVTIYLNELALSKEQLYFYR